MHRRIVDSLIKAGNFREFLSFEEFLVSGKIKLTEKDRYATFKIEMVPWWREIARWVDDPKIENIFLISASQCGKTLGMMSLLLYLAKSEPCRIMQVFDKEPIAKRFIVERLKPHIESFDNEVIKRSSWSQEYFKCYNATIMLGFASVYIRSWPCKYLLCDEIQDYQRSSLSLISKRLRTYRQSGGKLFGFGIAPRTADHPSWREVTDENVNVCGWFVPCLQCGEYQMITWEQIKFEGKRRDGSYDQNVVRESAVFCCKYCSYEHTEDKKLKLINKGIVKRIDVNTYEVLPDRETNAKTMIISSLYTPFTTWGELAVMFVKALGNPEALIVFSTDELCQVPEPGKYGRAVKYHTLERYVEERKVGIDERYHLITCGIDVQTDVLYVVISGFIPGPAVSVDIINYVKLPWRDKEIGYVDWDPFRGFFKDYENYIYRTCWDISDGNLAGLVVSFCRYMGPNHWPLRDMGNRQSSKIVYKVFDSTAGKIAKSGNYLSINSDLFKDDFLAMISRLPEEPGRISFPEKVHDDDEILRHFSAESRQINKYGRANWVKIGRRANHYFSAFIYSLAAASSQMPFLIVTQYQELGKSPLPRRRRVIFSLK